jgi:hypothetical protein
MVHEASLRRLHDLFPTSRALMALQPDAQHERRPARPHILPHLPRPRERNASLEGDLTSGDSFPARPDTCDGSLHCGVEPRSFGRVTEVSSERLSVHAGHNRNRSGGQNTTLQLRPHRCGEWPASAMLRVCLVPLQALRRRRSFGHQMLRVPRGVDRHVSSLQSVSRLRISRVNSLLGGSPAGRVGASGTRSQTTPVEQTVVRQ